MNRIFKYEDYCSEKLNLTKLAKDMGYWKNGYFGEVIDKQNQKRKLIEDIIKECLRDFCFSNSLNYEIVFGLYTKSGLFIPEGKSFQELMARSIATKFFSGPKGFKIIINKGSGNDIPKIGINLDNNEEFKNCITHLKFYLDKEFDIKIKIDSTTENDYVSEIKAEYE